MAATAAAPTSAMIKQMPIAPSETPAPIEKIKKTKADAKPKITKTLAKPKTYVTNPRECSVVLTRLPQSVFEYYMKKLTK